MAGDIIEIKPDWFIAKHHIIRLLNLTGFKNLSGLKKKTIILKNKIFVSEVVKKNLFICKW